jgi:hypothetical protein
LKQSTRDTEEWDKVFHPSLIVSATASSGGPGNKETQLVSCDVSIIHTHISVYMGLNVTAGLAPSVKKISFGSAGKPSRASIPAAIASRSPLIP